MSERVRAAGVSLRLPDGMSALRLLDPEHTAQVEAFAKDSPDHTVYHLHPSVEFENAHNQPTDMLLLLRDGNPLFALPLQRRARSFVQTAYTGALFPAAEREAALRRSTAAFAELLEANGRLAFAVMQSVLAPAHGALARPTLLRRQIEEHGFAFGDVFTRMIDLEPLDAPDGLATGIAELSPDWLENEVLSSYDADARNQIRQSLRRGVTVTAALGSSANPPDEFLELLHDVQFESRTRTGMRPRGTDYWLGLSRSITDAGGHDLVVLARAEDGTPIAGVTCHLYGGSALYWSGASNETGLRDRANPLSLHAAISVCAAAGITRFETGRFEAREASDKVRAITRYKAQFGGRVERVNTFVAREPLARRSLAILHARQRVIGAVYERVRGSRAAGGRADTVAP